MADRRTEVVVLATARAQAGKVAELERALRDAAAPTRAQPGCLWFDLYRPAQDPSAVTAIERWASEEDHQRHLQGDHVKTLMGRIQGILTGPPEIVAMRPI